MVDYSKIGFRLIQSAEANETKLGKKLGDISKPIQVTPKMLNDCDTVIIQNKDKVIELCNKKPLINVASELNFLGDIAHKFQGLLLFKEKNESIENIEKYFKSINMINLYNSYQKYGLDGLYTFLLNKQAAGTNIETFQKVEKALEKEYKKCKINNPNIEIKLKGIIHQGDIAFLPWIQDGFETPKTIKLPNYNDKAKVITEKYLSEHRIDEQIPNGFRDGGRNIRFSECGNIDYKFMLPYREILVVDRNSDAMLNKTIDGFKSILKRNPYLTPEEKVKTLYTYVYNLFQAKAPANALERFPEAPISIGSVIESGVGSCRHMALVAKLIGDEIGMNISLVRGKIGDSFFDLTNHAWNEVKLSNGEKYLLDVAQRKLVKFSADEDIIKKYYDINKNEMYKNC